MVRMLYSCPVANSDGNQSEVKYKEYAGLSTDTKPTAEVATGSTFQEVDTGKVFSYDEVSQTWIEIGGDAT